MFWGGFRGFLSERATLGTSAAEPSRGWHARSGRLSRVLPGTGDGAFHRTRTLGPGTPAQAPEEWRQPGWLTDEQARAHADMAGAPAE